MDDRKCSGKPRDLCESVGLSRVQIGLETTELLRTKRNSRAPYVGGRPSTRSPRAQQSRPTDAAAPRDRAPRPRCASRRQTITHVSVGCEMPKPSNEQGPLAAASPTAKRERPRSTCARASPRCASRPARGRVHATSTRDFYIFFSHEIKFSRTPPLRRGAEPASGKRRLRRVPGKTRLRDFHRHCPARGARQNDAATPSHHPSHARGRQATQARILSQTAAARASPLGNSAF